MFDESFCSVRQLIAPSDKNKISLDKLIRLYKNLIFYFQINAKIIFVNWLNDAVSLVVRFGWFKFSFIRFKSCGVSSQRVWHREKLFSRPINQIEAEQLWLTSLKKTLTSRLTLLMNPKGLSGGSLNWKKWTALNFKGIVNDKTYIASSNELLSYFDCQSMFRSSTSIDF